MNALELMLTRRSHSKLQNPAPDHIELDSILQAGCSVPDHANLQPWRFIVCQGAGLDKLGNIFQTASINKGMGQEAVERAATLPHRAPLIIIAIAKYTPHEKVPRVEQIGSSACSTYAMLLAANSLGYQGIWRTGWLASDEYVKQSVGCERDDELIGFLYLGSACCELSERKNKLNDSMVERWQ